MQIQDSLYKLRQERGWHFTPKHSSKIDHGQPQWAEAVAKALSELELSCKRVSERLLTG